MSMNISTLSPELCSGCAACMDRCPVEAITMHDDKDGNRRPLVDEDRCISCKQCTKVCPQFSPLSYGSNEKKAFVGYYNNTEITKKSSSGGMFILLAQYIISEKKGVVYGAAMMFENETLQCRHIRIENIEELHRLQGSKYVQSHTDGIFSKVKEDLKTGHTVLFSGTSCQVAALRNFVGESDRLFTIDLVCHGVPKDYMFRDYITYLESKYGGKVTDMSFRSKEPESVRKAQSYSLTIQFKAKDDKPFQKIILRHHSGYFCLFSNRSSYRQSCYNCPYATLQKPGDITLGDFRPRTNEIKNYNLSPTEHYSTIIVHSDKGSSLMDAVASQSTIVRMPVSIVLTHHLNLQSPSIASPLGKKMLRMYVRWGYALLQLYIRYFNLKQATRKIVKSIKRR